MNFILRIPRLVKRLISAIIYKYSFQKFGISSIYDRPLRYKGSKNISIGNHCVIQYKTWLEALPLTGNNVQLIIEDGCVVGHFNHIYATKSIVLHKNVLTADKVYISDNLHGYEDISTPIISQPIVQNRDVEIGEGAWIGENVCILGAHIGKNCVIGANSVVTHDIPDYSVAVGSPAKVIKQYDFNQKRWIRIK